MILRIDVILANSIFIVSCNLCNPNLELLPFNFHIMGDICST